MARKPSKSEPVQPSSYELLARRIQKQILSPRAQLERRVEIARLPEESEEDWALLVDQIGEEESVLLTPRDGGAVLLTWSRLQQD